MSYRYSDEELISKLQDFAEELGRPPSQNDMDIDGPHAAGTYYSRFGSWNQALEAAGLETGTNNTRVGANPTPKDELLTELKNLSKKLGGTPSQNQMDEKGKYSSKTYWNRFGTWNNAIRKAGLEPNVRIDVPREECLDKLKKFVSELGRTPTSSELNERGPFTRKLYERKFGSWNDALRSAGLEIHNEYSVSEEDLIADLRRLADELGRTPLRKDVTEQGQYSSAAYYHKFGRWYKSLEAAGMDDGEHHEVTKEDLIQDLRYVAALIDRCPRRIDIHRHTRYSLYWYDRIFGSIDSALRYALPDSYGQKKWDHYLNKRMPTGDNWKKQRQRALERDRFKCSICAVDQEIHKEETGFPLHVHHRKPRSYFYKHPDKRVEDANELSNLITLCSSCHRSWENIPVQPAPRQVS